MNNTKLTLKNLIEKEKIFILKGSFGGYFEKFIEPVINPTTLNNTINPVLLTPYAKINAYIIISKTDKNDQTNHFYNIQIILAKNNLNILQFGLGILNNNELKFNLTETQNLIGTITYDDDTKTFLCLRISLPSPTTFIDQGEFNNITICQFEKETGIKI